MASRGRSFVLLRSKMTSDGRSSRTRDSTRSALRSNAISRRSDFAAVEILVANMRSSTAHRIIGYIVLMILETLAAPPFYKNGFVVGCERTRQAVVIDPGDEVVELLAAGRR